MANENRETNRAVWKYVAIGAGCVVLGAAVLVGMKLHAKPNTHPKTTQQQSINIGIPINDSPGFSSMQDGQRNGFDIDLANYIADALGNHPNFVPITVDSREQELKQKYIDLAISTYSITDKRIGEGVIFAGPYLRTDQGILVSQDDNSMNSIDDLAGKTVCVTKGSTSADKLDALEKTIPAISLERDTFTQCLDDLKNPETNVSALTNDTVILQGQAHANSSLKVLPGIIVPGTYEKYGVGLSKDNMGLCHQVATILKSFVNTQWNAAFTANIQTDTNQNVSALKPDPSTIDTESCRTD
ncbi:MAG: transporter substrate-binding domain-containing protein [Candidatus Saccharibacteria bacterium]